MKTRDMTLVAVMAALICAAGPLTIAIGPIPLSLATFAIYMAGAMLGWKRGAMAVGVYLLIGFVGVPVFSGFTAGVQKLAGPTGGYLVGYLPCAMITGLGVPGSGSEHAPGEARRPMLRLGPCMAVGTAALYAVGTAWFMAQSGSALAAALGVCVLPFLPGDAIKIIGATLLAIPARRAVWRPAS